MSKRDSLFILRSHNEVDHIVPILYKIGERGKITADVVLTDRISLEDYRIKLIDKYDNVSIYNGDDGSRHPLVLKEQLISYIKEFGRKIPTKIPENIHEKYKSNTELEIPGTLDVNDYSVIGFDWSLAKSPLTDSLSKKDDITTLVLPHGDSPFRNRLETQEAFQRFIENKRNFIKNGAPPRIGYKNYAKMLKHDYLLFPNERTADRIKKYENNHEQIRIFGSPRYNEEWLNILNEIRPRCPFKKGSSTHIVIFLRIQEYFVSKREVKNTIQLLEQFPNIQIIIKEHPRNQLLDRSVSNGLNNVCIVADEIQSTSLIKWGDIFLSLGTTITFEPIMRRKPVLALEYTHANHTIISHYFSNIDMRCKDDLYYTIHDILEKNDLEFYDDQDYQQFIEEMITNSNESVLDSWAEFIESHIIHG